MRAGLTAPRAASRQRGIALVLVLWLTVLLTVIAGTFAYDMRAEVLSARNSVSLAQARAIADGAIDRYAFELSRPRLIEAWRTDGRVHAWDDGPARILAYAVDESARIDINAASDPLLKTLLMNVGGVDEPTANTLVDQIADWRDTDDLRRPNGAEESDYRAAGSKYKPANSAFESIGDLTRVLGMTPELFARISPSITVHSRVPGVNPFTASRSVLMSIPNVTAEQVDTYLTQRQAAFDNGLTPPPFPWIQGYGTAPTPVSRIHAEVAMPDGVTFSREAVVRSSMDPRRPLVVLAWIEAQRSPSSAAVPGTASDGAPSPNAMPLPNATSARSSEDARRP